MTLALWDYSIMKLFGKKYFFTQHFLTMEVSMAHNMHWKFHANPMDIWKNLSISFLPISILLKNKPRLILPENANFPFPGWLFFFFIWWPAARARALTPKQVNSLKMPNEADYGPMPPPYIGALWAKLGKRFPGKSFKTSLIKPFPWPTNCGLKAMNISGMACRFSPSMVQSIPYRQTGSCERCLTPKADLTIPEKDIILNAWSLPFMMCLEGFPSQEPSPPGMAQNGEKQSNSCPLFLLAISSCLIEAIPVLSLSWIWSACIPDTSSFVVQAKARFPQ